MLVVATNPVDVTIHLAARYAADCDAPDGRVVGYDFIPPLSQSSRTALRVDPQHIHAHVIGEHGDSEVLTWSLVTVSGMPLSFVNQRSIIRTGAKIDQQAGAATDHQWQRRHLLRYRQRAGSHR